MPGGEGHGRDSARVSLSCVWRVRVRSESVSVNERTTGGEGRGHECRNIETPRCLAFGGKDEGDVMMRTA